jgi:N-acetylneuraminic acid mutarotase
VLVVGQEVPLRMTWSELPQLPDHLGLAGPFVGVHGDALIVAGGANFAEPVWENDKRWHDTIHVLVREGSEYRWSEGGRLSRPVAYGASVSTADGVLCIGGNDASETFRDVFLLQFDPSTRQVQRIEYPSLPTPCAFGGAALLGDVVYLIAGQRGTTLDSATNEVWALDLAQRANASTFHWTRRDPMPGPTRALPVVVGQHNASSSALYVISGRRQQGDAVEFLRDVWRFTPATHSWNRCEDVPRCVMGGSGVAVGSERVLVLGGDEGTHFHEVDRLRDKHPGFARETWLYHAPSDRWSPSGQVPVTQVTTNAVPWLGAIIIPSGEIRPRVRTPRITRVMVEVIEDE